METETVTEDTPQETEEDHGEGGEGEEGEEKKAVSDSDERLPLFRPFTVESLKRIRKRIEKSAAVVEEERMKKGGSGLPGHTPSSPPGAAAAVATATVAADTFAGIKGSVSPAEALPSARQAPGTGGEGELEEPRPDPQFEAGKSLPKKFGDFPPNLFGRPIEDLDQFYSTKYVRTPLDAL